MNIFVREMKSLHSRYVESLSVVLSSLTYAISISLETFITLDPTAHVLHVSLLTCDSACRCARACVDWNYTSGRLYCDLGQGNLTAHSLYLEGRIAYFKADNNSLPKSDEVSDTPDRLCSTLNLPACPDLVTNGNSVVLHNLTKLRSQRLVQLAWSPGQDGWKYTSCTAYNDCTDRDTRKMRSTMRDMCNLDSECVDAESECRDGQCWCKPGLSHDPDTMTCVALCPRGQYGKTFQIIQHAYIQIFSKIYMYNYMVEDLHMCMAKCISYKGPRLCMIGNYYADGGSCMFGLHLKSDRNVSRVKDQSTEDNVEQYALQRDCFAVVN